MTAEHGTASRYRYGCRCAPCRYGHSAQRRTSRPFGDAEAVRAHIRELSAAGIGYRRVADLAGTSHKTVFRILAGQVRPTARVADAVLAVTAEVGPAERWPDVTGARRRLQALNALGWTNRELATLTRADESGLCQIISRRGRVLRSTVASVKAVYEDLSMQVPGEWYGSKRARQRALKRCWFPPLAWDDETIDDAEALPCLLPPVEPVDRDLELLVQHLAAGHPVEPTPAAVREVILRMPGAKPAEIAKVAQRPARAIANIRSHMKAAA